MYLSYFGIRVTDIRRSAEFYMQNFGLRPVKGVEVPSKEPLEPTPLLLLDPVSGQRLELNYYPPGNPYAVPYAAGEGLDHLAFRVDDLEKSLAELRARGVVPENMKHFEGPFLSTPQYRVAYVRDPDGNQIELFDIPLGDPGRFDRETY
jgi:glyoxylase I family protein